MKPTDQPYVALPFDRDGSYPDGAVFVVRHWQDGEYPSRSWTYEYAEPLAEFVRILDRHFSAPCDCVELHVRVPLFCDHADLFAALHAVNQRQAA